MALKANGGEREGRREWGVERRRGWEIEEKEEERRTEWGGKKIKEKEKEGENGEWKEEEGEER